MKRRGFLQFFGLAALVPEVLKAEELPVDDYIAPISGRTDTIHFPSSIMERYSKVANESFEKNLKIDQVLNSSNKPITIFGESTIELDHGASQVFERVK